MTDTEILDYRKAIQEYSPNAGDHAEAVYGFLGSMGALTMSYALGKRFGIAINVLDKAFEYERHLARKET